MAGGDKRGNYGTMADRVAATAAAGSHQTVNTPRQPSLSVAERRERAEYRAVEPCHVTVLTEAGAVPGLLTEWRKPVELPWEGQVVLTRRVDDTWALVREWLPAGAIAKTALHS